MVLTSCLGLYRIWQKLQIHLHVLILLISFANHTVRTPKHIDLFLSGMLINTYLVYSLFSKRYFTFSKSIYVYKSEHTL